MVPSLPFQMLLPRNAGSRALDLTVLSDTIADPGWWAYSRMLLQVHLLVKHFSSWAEACPCHGPFHGPVSSCASQSLSEDIPAEMEEPQA